MTSGNPLPESRSAKGGEDVKSCYHPDFCQSVPTDRPVRLINGDQKTSHSLVYEDVGGGQRYVVPTIWYNMPVEHHQQEARRMLRDANAAARSLLLTWRHHRKDPDPSLRRTIDAVCVEDFQKERRVASECAQRLREMRQTGCIRISTLRPYELMHNRWWC